MTLTPAEISAFLAIETHRHPLVAERRELVVRGLVEGKTHSEIAAELNVSRHTVVSDANVMRKRLRKGERK